MVRLMLVVTGASRGLGRCITKAFHEETNRTTTSAEKATSICAHLIARSEDNLYETRHEILQTLHNNEHRANDKADRLQTHISIHPMDLSNLETLEDQMGAVFDELAENMADFDRFIFINNHGTLGHLGPCLEETNTLKDMQDAINLNVTSCLWISVMAARFFQKHAASTRATIVNISSLAAVQPFPTMGIYSAGKAARDMYHACLAKELQPNSDDTSNTISANIKILNYAPGPLETDMTAQLRSQKDLDRNLQAFFQKQQLDPMDSARVLVRLVLDNEFESGTHVDYYDVVSPVAEGQSTKVDSKE